jgi:hypothetical protein
VVFNFMWHEFGRSKAPGRPIASEAKSSLKNAMPPQHARLIVAATCGICSFALIYNTPAFKQAFLQLPSLASPEAAAAAVAPAPGTTQEASAAHLESMGSLGAFHFEVTGKVNLLLLYVFKQRHWTAANSASSGASNTQAQVAVRTSCETTTRKYKWIQIHFRSLS